MEAPPINGTEVVPDGSISLSKGEQSRLVYDANTLPANTIAPRSRSGAIELRNLDDAMQLGNVLAQSGFFGDVRDAAQAVVKILAGAEYGLGPIASMRSIHVFDGQTTLHYTLVGAMIKKHPIYDYRVQRSDATGAQIEFFEHGQSVGTASFTIEDAKRAGLLGKKNWRSYPEDMCFGRAMTRGARKFCPVVFDGPIYVDDEIEPMDIVSPKIVSQQVEAEGEAINYEERRMQISKWLEAKGIEDLEDAILEARGKVSDWPKQDMMLATAIIDGEEEKLKRYMAKMEKFGLAVSRAFEEGTLEACRDKYDKLFRNLPEKWKAYAKQVYERVIGECELSAIPDEFKEPEA